MVQEVNPRVGNSQQSHREDQDNWISKVKWFVLHLHQYKENEVESEECHELRMLRRHPEGSDGLLCLDMFLRTRFSEDVLE